MIGGLHHVRHQHDIQSEYPIVTLGTTSGIVRIAIAVRASAAPADPLRAFQQVAGAGLPKDQYDQNKPIDDFFSPSSIEIRRGVSAGCQHWLDQQIVNYIQAVENRMCVIHGAFSMTVEDIGDVTKEAAKQIRMMPGAAPDEKPIVIIDYLFQAHV